MRSSLALALLLSLVALLFWRVGTYEFTNWDDTWLISENPTLTQPNLENVKRVLFDVSAPTRNILGAEYLPARDLSIMFFGHENPHLLHLQNLFLYLLSCTLLFFLLRRLKAPPLHALLGTLLWALHPSHVETVAWLSERKSLLSMVFLLAGFLLVEARTRQKSVLLTLGSVACFTLATLSKYTAVVFLPLVMVLFWNRRHWKYYIALGLVTCLLLVVSVTVGSQIQMYKSWMGENIVSHGFTIPFILAQHVRYILFPYGIKVLTYIEPIASWTEPRFLLSVLLIATLVTLGVRSWKRNRWLSVVLLVFLISLLPVLQFFPIPNRFAARYLVLPTLALPLLWVGVAPKLSSSKQRVLAGLLVGGTLLAFGLESHRLLPRWQNCTTLWQEASRHADFSKLVSVNLYECYRSRGQEELAGKTLQASLHRHGQDPEILINWGQFLLRHGKKARAEEVFRRAWQMGGRKTDYQNNLATVRLQEGRLDEASELLRKLLRQDRHHAAAWANLGHIAVAQGQKRRAKFYFRRSQYEGLQSPGVRRKLAVLDAQHE